MNVDDKLNLKQKKKDLDWIKKTIGELTVFINDPIFSSMKDSNVSFKKLLETERDRLQREIKHLEK